MSFYGQKGDFYSGRTGYYRGDPGFLSNVFGGIVGAAKGYITSGGSWLGAARGAVGGFVKQHPVISAAGAAGTAMVGEQVVTHLPGRMPVPMRTGGGRTLPGSMGTPVVRGGMGMGAPGAGMRGYHVIKKGPHAGGLTRNRRMNPCNVRALRRAARRAHGFLRISRKLVGYYTPKHPKGRAFIRARKRRK